MGLSDKTTVLTQDLDVSGISTARFASSGAVSNVSSSRGTFATVWATSALSGQMYAPAGSAVTPGIGFASEISLGFYRSGASTVALSYGTFNLNTAQLVSIYTAAGSSITQYTDVLPSALFITVGASGLSIGIRSANSLYWVTSTTSSA